MKNQDYLILEPDNGLVDSEITRLLKSSDSIGFHTTLKDYNPSPIHRLSKLAEELGVRTIFLKDESTRFGLKAFKGLGTSYAVNQILQSKHSISTFCTATDGNHGKALAWSARLAGKKAVIVVPAHTTPARIMAIEAKDAEVIRFEGNYDDACKYAEKLSEQDGWKLVQDVAWDGYENIPAYIMAGYLSMFKELENNLHLPDEPLIDVVLLQAGVGSFASSAVWYYLNRYGNKKPKIVIIEPTEADGIFESFKHNQLKSSLGKQETIMAGLNCGLPSSIAWPVLKAGTDAVIRIEDQYSELAMRKLYYNKASDPQVISGESGAAGLAGLLAILQEEKFNPLMDHLGISHHSRILLFNTEGDTDPISFKKIVT